MEDQSLIKKFALSFVVFVGALALTYGVSTYLERKPSDESSQSLNKSKSDLVFYKAVGQTTDTSANETERLHLKYTVEILATGDRTEAEKYVAKLKEQNVEAFYTPYQSGAQVVYRIRQGIFDDQGQAKVAVKELQKHGISGKVIQLD